MNYKLYYSNFYNNTPRCSVNKIVEKMCEVFYEPQQKSPSFLKNGPWENILYAISA